MEVRQIVNLLYVIGGVIVFVVADKFVAWVWPPFQEGVNSALRALGATSNILHNYSIVGSYVTVTSIIAFALAGWLMYELYQPEEYRSFLSEVVIELKKVTWPGWDETRRSTLIVIVFTIVLSGLVWLSDTVWKYVTNMLLTAGA
ncbi:MAG: preprotein translocase subunit SecE [Bradymonadaceae bacterium]